jgi:hypothetical protein
VTEIEFDGQYLCVFTVDERTCELQDRLQQYYQDTPDSMSNKNAFVHWKKFKKWACLNGYSSQEINHAKRQRLDCE